MAKIELKHLDIDRGKTWIKTFKDETQADEFIAIELYDEDTNIYNSIYLDKSTAIRFAKTLRTEINKIKS